MPMKTKELIKLLKKNGWELERQKGSHMQFKHPNFDKIITVPNHSSKELGVGLLNKILKDSGLI